MAINPCASNSLLLIFAALAAVSGCCCQAIPLPAENQCPTDARRLYHTFGEEAVRRCPCGPSGEFYGLKPTCWREWPEGWHCNGVEGMPYRASCGEPVASIGDVVHEIPGPVMVEPQREQPNTANPFHNKTDATELPLPTHELPVRPEPTPAKAALAREQARKVATSFSPTWEKVSAKPKLAQPIHSEARSPEDPSAKAAMPVLIRPIVNEHPVESASPQPMPAVPAAIKLSESLPILFAPLNGPQTLVVAEPELLPEQPAATLIEKEEQVLPVQQVTRLEPLPAPEAATPALSPRVEHHLINNLEL